MKLKINNGFITEVCDCHKLDEYQNSKDLEYEVEINNGRVICNAFIKFNKVNYGTRINYRYEEKRKNGIDMNIFINKDNVTVEKGFIDFYRLKLPAFKRNVMFRLEFEYDFFRLYEIASRKYFYKRQIGGYMLGYPITLDDFSVITSRMVDNIHNDIIKHNKPDLSINSNFYQDFNSFFSILNDPLQVLKLALLSEYISDEDKNTINMFIAQYQGIYEEPIVLARQNKSN